MKTVLLRLFLLLAGMAPVCAQTIPVDTSNGKPYYILLKDGSHIQGRIIKRDSTMYTVRMKNGQLTYVETALFGQISSVAPTMTDTAAYFSQQSYARPNASPPVQTTVSPSQYEITLTDGTTLNAVVLSQDSSRVVVKTEALGTVYIPARRIVRMERVQNPDKQAAQQRKRSSGSPNLFPQYLNFLPSAYQAERGRVYFRNSSVYISQFDVGITDNWSVGASFFTFVPSLFGSLSTKVSVPVGVRVRLGIQAQLLYGSLFDRTASTGLIQGIVSIGDSQNNVTVGLGTGTSRYSIGQIGSVSIVRKLRPSLTFISENILLFGGSNSRYSIGKLSAGLRFDRVRHSFDLSANIPFGPDGIVSGSNVVLFPTASYQVRLGK
ncbi:hypothetical protein [Fibrella forsythiae]|uniref:SH3 domain-containing protein n=1 Tax=Fibrella forsythiae TaxID=2817061 RepID=A0ABS3JAW2_9BACT|nr:hypothetical protein [Fibrella forsythiae]MBO0947118.1 hypothetical protein [Fibrella forsythiae]